MSDTSNQPPRKNQGDAGKQSSHAESRVIATGLKSLYRTVIEEPIPDDLMDLLNSLDDDAS